MRRGFKAYSERKALEVRQLIGVKPNSRIDCPKFAESQGFIIWGPNDVPNLDPAHAQQLLSTDPDSWSGLTVRLGANAIIVVNSAHTPGRQANTIMHEWAHVELNHKPSRVDDFGNGLLLLSEYPSDFEEEADWLAAAVLLPREGLLDARRSETNVSGLADRFGVSMELVKWRLRMTGIDRQLAGRV